jgi:hypothetical protein
MFCLCGRGDAAIHRPSPAGSSGGGADQGRARPPAQPGWRVDHREMGSYLSWESASMALKRSSVRFRLAPPIQSNKYRGKFIF